jgi:hypothetical protein
VAHQHVGEAVGAPKHAAAGQLQQRLHVQLVRCNTEGTGGIRGGLGGRDYVAPGPNPLLGAGQQPASEGAPKVTC